MDRTDFSGDKSSIISRHSLPTIYAAANISKRIIWLDEIRGVVEVGNQVVHFVAVACDGHKIVLIWSVDDRLRLIRLHVVKVSDLVRRQARPAVDVIEGGVAGLGHVVPRAWPWLQVIGSLGYCLAGEATRCNQHKKRDCMFEVAVVVAVIIGKNGHDGHGRLLQKRNGSFQRI